jgi:hypothetical protein
VEGDVLHGEKSGTLLSCFLSASGKRKDRTVKGYGPEKVDLMEMKEGWAKLRGEGDRWARGREAQRRD